MDFRFLIFIFLGGVIASCGTHIPNVNTCLFDEPRQIFHCNDPQGKAFDLISTDPKADKLVCLPFNDIGIVLNYCNSLKSR